YAFHRRTVGRWYVSRVLDQLELVYLRRAEAWDGGPEPRPAGAGAAVYYAPALDHPWHPLSRRRRRGGLLLVGPVRRGWLCLWGYVPVSGLCHGGTAAVHANDGPGPGLERPDGVGVLARRAEPD